MFRVKGLFLSLSSILSLNFDRSVPFAFVHMIAIAGVKGVIDLKDLSSYRSNVKVASSFFLEPFQVDERAEMGPNCNLSS